MRIVGALLIITASLCMGVIYIREKRKRINTLSSLCTALDIMKGEMEARLAAMPDICRFLSDKLNGPAGEFFRELSEKIQLLGEKDFSGIWRDSAEEKLSFLETEELDELMNLSEVLGRFQLSEQLRAIAQCRSGLREGLEQARIKYPEQQKLSLGLGTAGALLLVLGLI